MKTGIPNSQVYIIIVTDTDPKAFVAIAQGHQSTGGVLRKAIGMVSEK